MLKINNGTRIGHSQHIFYNFDAFIVDFEQVFGNLGNYLSYTMKRETIIRITLTLYDNLSRNIRYRNFMESAKNLEVKHGSNV